MYTRLKIDTRTRKVLQVMHVFAWIGFVGFMIQASAILTTYSVSYINQAFAKNMYYRFNLDELKQFSFLHYTSYMFLMIAMPGLKAFVLYQLIKVIGKVNLTDPFRLGITQRLEK